MQGSGWLGLQPRASPACAAMNGAAVSARNEVKKLVRTLTGDFVKNEPQDPPGAELAA